MSKFVVHVESDEQGVWPSEAVRAFMIQKQGAQPWDVLDALAATAPSRQSSSGKGCEECDGTGWVEPRMSGGLLGADTEDTMARPCLCEAGDRTGAFGRFERGAILSAEVPYWLERCHWCATNYDKRRQVIAAPYRYHWWCWVRSRFSLKN